MATLPSPTVDRPRGPVPPSVEGMTTTPRRPSPAELESSLEAYFREIVRRRLGGMVIKLAPTVKGLPDRIVLLPGGRIQLVELKTTSGSLSAIQRIKHDRILELGTEVAVLSGRAEVDRWVEKQFPSFEQIIKDRARSPRGMSPAKALSAEPTRNVRIS